MDTVGSGGSPPSRACARIANRSIGTSRVYVHCRRAMKDDANGMTKNAGNPESVGQERPLAVSIRGPEEETPELWADLVEFVLAARRCARRKADEDRNGNAA